MQHACSSNDHTNLETSRKARFMIPMAMSLGYGILFATLITLLLVPGTYLITDDVRSRHRINTKHTLAETMPGL